MNFVHGPGRAELRLLTAILAFAGPLCARDFYVSPTGKDSNPGTLARPFRTITNEVCKLHAGDTLYLRQGVYREALYAARGGSAAAPIVFSGYKSETAVLAGSDVLSGTWKPYQGKIWSLDAVSPTADLFVDGREMAMARWPSVAPGEAMDEGWAVAGAGTDGTDLIDPTMPDLALAGARIHIVPGLAWVSYTRTIQDYGHGRLTFSSPICDTTPAYCPRPGNRYFLYGSLALLRGPGEWFQDPVTNRIYLWCPDGLSPDLHRVEDARRKAVIRDDGFSHIVFQKLYTFCGGIKISHCVGCRVDRVNQLYVQHFTEVQGYDCENPVNSLYGGDDCEWGSGSIEGSSGDGLAVSGARQHIHNMIIHDVCRDASYAAALFLLGRDQTVEDNTFYDSGRYLIDLGNAQGGRIVHNNLYNAGLLTKDVGAIYSYRTDGAGMVIAYNHVHNVASVRGVGIYLDNGDSDYIVDHNLVQDCAWAAVELNLPSMCNVICNNTLVGCRHWVWADGAPHSMIGTMLVNNLYTGTDLLTGHHLAPCLAGNVACLGPGTVFAPGGFTLAPRSPAIAAGLAIPPFTDGQCSKVPDLGAFEYGCGPAWTSGATLRPKPFPYPSIFYKRAMAPKARGGPVFLDPQMGARPEPRGLKDGGTQWS